jgi:hypothetical protein
MSKVKTSAIPELQRFANGLERDKAAVLVRVEVKLCRFRKEALPLFAMDCQKKRERRLRFRRETLP